MSLKDSFFDLPPELMTALGTVLGFALIGDLTSNQQDTLGNWLQLIGQLLEVNSAQQQLLEQRQSAALQKTQLAQMQEAIQALQKEVERLTGRPINPQSPRS